MASRTDLAYVYMYMYMHMCICMCKREETLERAVASRTDLAELAIKVGQDPAGPRHLEAEGAEIVTSEG